MLCALVWLVMGVSALAAQVHPGHFPVELLAGLTDEDLVIDINLQGTILRLIAAVEKDDPELAELINGLERVRVRVGNLTPSNEKQIRSSIDEAVAQLEKQGWQMIVRAKGKEEEVALYIKEQPTSSPGDTDTDIAGLTMLAISENEHVAMVNIVGRFDPERIAELPVLEDLDLGADLLRGSDEGAESD